tara:strand:- start:686 stop:1111 length:426 start_codon:yes stop_codon:yes gene_type:complete
MGHFAKVNSNNIVTTVIVAKQDYIDTLPDKDSYIKTSYNTYGGTHWVPGEHFITPSADQSKALRKNYAGIGCIYDPVRDAFYSPQPFDSWILNESTCWWEPPITEPERTSSMISNRQWWRWDEDAHQADNTTGWVAHQVEG